jgi:hypothetical protein
MTKFKMNPNSLEIYLSIELTARIILVKDSLTEVSVTT